jgi:GT2 family glycosyltransferase
MTRVDLIIPTHNGGPLLAACLRSLQSMTFQDVRLIVVDDASREPVAPLVLHLWPGATVLRSEVNFGLAAGLNRAIAASSSEFIVLLNDDTEVEPLWLGALVACADRHPTAGSVASKLRLLSDRTRLHAAGDYFSVRGIPGNRGVWLQDYGQFDREEPIFGACAGAALYRRSALEAVARHNGQIFDERLFMYCEDVDLAWRLQSHGRMCVFAPDAIVYHHVSATAGGTLASYYVGRNLPLVLRRSVPAGVLRPYRWHIAATYAGRLFRALRYSGSAAARATIRGMLAGALLAMVARSESERLPEAELARMRALLTDIPARRTYV